MGYEYITQPTVFLAPITAVAGTSAFPQRFPLLTSYAYWDTIITTPQQSAFTIPDNPSDARPVLPEPGSFIVTIGGVLQNPNKYTVDAILKRIVLKDPITSGFPLEANFVQLATHAPSSQYFNYIEANTAFITNLTSNTNVFLTSNKVTQALSSIGIDALTSINGFITNLTTVNVYGGRPGGRVYFYSPLSATINSSFDAFTITQAGTANYFTVRNPSTNNAVFTVNKNSTVGVNVSAPTEALEVNGNIRASNGSVIATNQLVAPKVTVTEAQINYLYVSEITATNVNYFVTEVSAASSVFSNSDNSKSFHFNTTNSSITAIFPRTLANGFNISIVNTGTKTIFISSAQTPFINATGILNSSQYSGMFIYKSNNQLFGVGVFE